MNLQTRRRRTRRRIILSPLLMFRLIYAILMRSGRLSKIRRNSWRLESPESRHRSLWLVHLAQSLQTISQQFCRKI
jgi:hypothetical protein